MSCSRAQHTVTPVRLQHAPPQSQVQLSTTEPLCNLGRQSRQEVHGLVYYLCKPRVLNTLLFRNWYEKELVPLASEKILSFTQSGCN